MGCFGFLLVQGWFIRYRMLVNYIKKKIRIFGFSKFSHADSYAAKRHSNSKSIEPRFELQQIHP
jgi:hypothetical protein